MQDETPTSVAEHWDVDRLEDLTRLVSRSHPDDQFLPDEIRSACWDGEGVVLGLPDGSAAAALVVNESVASVMMLAVDPRTHFGQTGHLMMAAVEGWARSIGASTIRVGGRLPAHCWLGVDGAAEQLSALLETEGYVPHGSPWSTLSLPTATRAAAPDGVVIARVLDDGAALVIQHFVDERWPAWRPAIDRAIEQGSCLVASDTTGAAIGFVCHSVGRAGWIGPIGVDPGGRDRGVGRALLGDAARDLMVAGHKDATVVPPDPWAVDALGLWPVPFFERCGASPSRSFQRYAKDLTT